MILIDTHTHLYSDAFNEDRAEVIQRALEQNVKRFIVPAIDTSYFEAILKNVTIHNDYDVYGHIDYVVRYGKESKEEFLYTYYADILDSILMTLIEKGKGIEVNTSGFKYDIGGLHPHISILKRYKELGGEILTIGSDAHETRHLAYKFDKAGSILRDCGFKHYTVFKDRKPEFLSL